MVLFRKYELWILFSLLVAVLIFRVNVESTQYCTPDSKYYLEVSNNILSGIGPVGPKVFDYNPANQQLRPLYEKTPFGRPEEYKKEYFAVWPLGYPLSIVAVSFITNIPPLWASKLLNIFLLALDFYLLYKLFKGTSYLPMYYFGSFTMLEICSYTWSENLFLTFFILYILCHKKIHETSKLTIPYALLLAFALTGMCLARYASAIFFVISFSIMFWHYKNKETPKSYLILIALITATLFFGAYLSYNYLQVGYLTGMPRVYTQDFSASELIQKLFIGLFHQLHIAKHFRFSGLSDFLFYSILTLLQIAVMIYTYINLRATKTTEPMTTISKILIYTGCIYLIFLTYMTFTSTIDPFDYRTLLPFSFPLTIALLYEIETKLKTELKNNTILVIKFFFLLSLFANIPKKFLLELIIQG